MPMSGYIPPYPPEILFNPALPLPGDQSWRPPAPSAQVALQQPFDWPVPPALPSSGFPAQEPFRSYEVNGNGFYEGAPGGLPIQPQPLLQPSETGWGFPRGGALHVAAGLPDEMLPKHFGAGSELVKVTGKSCSSCRTRKVKCDRRYPECSRCTKRKEVCDYGHDVSFALRPVVVLNRTRDDDSADSNQSSPRGAVFGSSNNAFSTHHRRPSSSLALPYPPPRLPFEDAPARSLRTVSDFRHQLARKTGPQGQEEGDTQDDRQPGFQKLWDRFLDQSNLGESSSDWRLALPTMASSLTLHLLDASMNSCCYHLPAFHVFNPHIAYYKENLNSLDVASRAVVGILTSLGARASPHSALLGVAGPDIENGNASHEVVLSAGVRRESAWRAIVKNATELCSKLEVLQVPSIINAQTLVAFVQMLMFSEVKPKTARFFLRAALGIFYDMQGGGLPPHEIDVIKRSVGVSLYESDARISAWLSLSPLISEDDLFDYFDGTGVHLVDFEREDLSNQLSTLFDSSRGPMSSEKAEEALRITGFYVCAVQRLFAKISSSRRPSTRFLSNVEQLWDYIDGAHAACQLLTGTLRAFAMAQDDLHHPAHHDLLIGLRMHERRVASLSLLDVMNLSNEWLRSKRQDNLSHQDRNALEAFLGVSNRRVRRCLKVLAFYAKVFHDSHDKHVVYHLFTQLEAVEGWATMAAQGEDEIDEFGPIGSQCVLTETELDYFSQALELSCFYTPLSAQRLKEFTRARQARNERALRRFSPIAEYDITPPYVGQNAARNPGSLPLEPPSQARFTEVDHERSTPPAHLPTLAQTQSFQSADSAPVYSRGPAQSPTQALSSWLLSGYAESSSKPDDAFVTESESPSTSSSGISPGYAAEQGTSSPETTSSFAASLGFLPEHLSRRPSFLTPLSTNPDSPNSFLASLHTPNDPTGGGDIAFPSSNLTNLAQTFPPQVGFPTGLNNNYGNETGNSRGGPHDGAKIPRDYPNGTFPESTWSTYSDRSMGNGPELRIS